MCIVRVCVCACVCWTQVFIFLKALCNVPARAYIRFAKVCGSKAYFEAQLDGLLFLNCHLQVVVGAILLLLLNPDLRLDMITR